MRDLADRFVRVRLTRIDSEDINLFVFDYDLTFAVFFLSADGKMYARYGARDETGPDARQSLEGLRYTMASVLEMHQREDKQFAPRVDQAPKYIRQIMSGRVQRGCVHCHQVREILDNQLKRIGEWTRERVWRYPLPDNLGLLLENNRGNVVQRVQPNSPAERAGLKPGDVVQRVANVPIHSLADVTFALDRAPRTGQIAVASNRAGEPAIAVMNLPEGWRKTDISWRPSLQNLVPFLPLYGNDLTADEKKTLGLSSKQMAFRQKERVHSRAQAAGIRAGDIIVGVDDRRLEGSDVDLQEYVRKEYLIGDRLVVNVLRDGKALRLEWTLH
jgi:serine protease Do